MPLDHFVPQVHLKQFRSPELGHLMHAIRKTDLKRFQCRSKDVCRIESGSTNAYLTNDRVLEEFLRIIEPRYDATLAKLQADEIDRDAILVVAGFAAYVSSCTPAAMRMNVAPFENLLESEIAILERQGRLPPAPAALGGKQLSELIADGAVVPVIDPKYPQSLGIQTVIPRTSIYGNSQWEILQCDLADGALFTSDYPIALEEVAGSSIPNWIVPLAPDLAVRIAPDPSRARRDPDLSFGGFRYKRRAIGSREIADLNRLIVRCAEEVVLSRVDSAWVVPFVAKNSGYRVEDVTTRIPQGRGFLHVVKRKIVPYVPRRSAGNA